MILESKGCSSRWKIELSDRSGDSGDISNRSLNPSFLQKQTLRETVGRYLAACEEYWPGSVPNPVPQTKKSSKQ